MSIYANKNGTSIKVASAVDIVDDNNSNSLNIDGQIFSVASNMFAFDQNFRVDQLSGGLSSTADMYNSPIGGFTLKFDAASSVDSNYTIEYLIPTDCVPLYLAIGGDSTISSHTLYISNNNTDDMPEKYRSIFNYLFNEQGPFIYPDGTRTKSWSPNVVSINPYLGIMITPGFMLKKGQKIYSKGPINLTLCVFPILR